MATEKGLAVIRSFEGRALKAYRDSAGVWTIGYGNTNFDQFAVAYLGRPIGAGMTITEEQAEFLLRHTIDQNYAPPVYKAMPGASEPATDAGISFHYNTGAIGRATWVKKWRQGAEFHDSILSWNKAGGKVLAGLTRRREREFQMITRGDYGPEGRTAPPVLDASGRPTAAAPAAPLTGTPGMLRQGDTGPEVADLNGTLSALGFSVTVPADQFGGVTHDAVMAFQRAHKQLAVDGVVGPATRAALNRESDALRKLKTTATATVTGGVASGAADAVAGGGLPVSVYVFIGLVGLIAAGWFAWTYRDELIAMSKR